MTATVSRQTGRDARIAAAKARMRELLTRYHRPPTRGWDEGMTCVDADPNLFSPQDAEGSRKQNIALEAVNRSNHEKAKTWCARCPVALDCLAEALVNNREGTWGGERLTATDWIAGKTVKEEMGL
jgi:hypothetical protein